MDIGALIVNEVKLLEIPKQKYVTETTYVLDSIPNRPAVKTNKTTTTKPPKKPPRPIIFHPIFNSSTSRKQKK